MRLFSIIIAVYNVEKYLEECLESVFMQNYVDWECILVDDGSTDTSLEICEKYAKRDRRFKVFHRENLGSLMARRYGLSQSRGDYLLFIDSDDSIHGDLLKDVDGIISATQSDLVIYRFQWVNKVQVVDSELIFPEGTIIGEGGLSKTVLWEKLPICNSLNNLWLKVVKRQCLDLDADYSKYAFLQFGTDLMQSLPILDKAQKIYFTEKIYYYYRYNDTGISSQKEKIKDIESID
ncbi:MAG: glycosyltransferase, partial [Lachnospiraceae bacterium]|nr:glycosyltransferase [Lachnospiraceae bacterium]